VELAIVLPAVLIALFASIQLGSWFLARSVALAAAQQATTAQRAYQAPAGAGESSAERFLARAGDWLVDPKVRVERDGTQVRTTVTGRALSLLPGVDLTVSQTARGEVERFTEDPP
jgi:hypothetical protein